MSDWSSSCYPQPCERIRIALIRKSAMCFFSYVNVWFGCRAKKSFGGGGGGEMESI